MEKPVLTDKNQFPTDEIIFSNIGKSKQFWDSLFAHISESYPEITKEWRYYNDGKSWLLKVTKKTKTIFWLSVVKNSFRISFYFTDKAEPIILDSGLPDELKEQFINGKRFNKIRRLSILFNNKKDVESAKILLAIPCKQIF
jgi:hypothetical protein